MTRQKCARFLAACLGVLLGSGLWPAPVGADESAVPATAARAELLSYARIFTGDDGQTHFGDVAVGFEKKGYGAGTPPVWLSEHGLMAAEGLHFVSMPAGWVGAAWHPTPARQFVIPLGGEMQFETSDGSRRSFGRGDILLLEDTQGTGHRSRMLGSAIGVFAVIPVPEP